MGSKTSSANLAFVDDKDCQGNNAPHKIETQVPDITIEIETDDVFVEHHEEVAHSSTNTDGPSTSNHLTVPEKSRPTSRPSSRASSRLSSTISIISVASSNISRRLDIVARSCCTRSFGLLLAFLSGVLMTAYSSMIKMLHEMDSMQVIIIRGVIQLLVFLIVALYKKHSFVGDAKKNTLIFLFLVVVTGGLRLLFIFTSFTRLPLGDSTTILFSSPVLVMIFSICILKEYCGLFRICAGASLMSGVVLIAKPPILFANMVPDDFEYDVVGYILVCSACFMSALGLVLTKKISKIVEKTVILFYMGIAYILFGSISLFTLGNPSIPSAHEWGMAVGISVLGVLQQYFLIYAVTLESPARVTIVRQMQIVLAYVVQIFMFHVMPMWSDLLGASLVLGTVVITSFEKQITGIKCCKPNQAKAEQKVKEIVRKISVVDKRPESLTNS